MSKTKIILAVTFLLVFAAGAVVGTVRQRVAVGPHGPDDRGSWITKELGLNPEQRDQMRRIWSEQGPSGGRDREHWDKRREYQHQRDDAIKALLTDEQRAKYDAIQKEYADHVADLGKERQAAFQQAVERTKAILTPQQAEKYETILKKRPEGGPGGPGGPGGGPPWRDRRDGRDGHDGPPPPATRP